MKVDKIHTHLSYNVVAFKKHAMDTAMINGDIPWNYTAV
jgi:hypothetical protein